MSEQKRDMSDQTNGPGKWATPVAFALLIAFFIVFPYVLMSGSLIRLIGQEIFARQFPTIFGIPYSVSIAYIVVTLLRYASGPIEFEGLGFKFRGASGPIIMWVFCFLSMVLGIKVLWQ